MMQRLAARTSPTLAGYRPQLVLGNALEPAASRGVDERAGLAKESLDSPPLDHYDLKLFPGAARLRPGQDHESTAVPKYEIRLGKPDLDVPVSADDQPSVAGDRRDPV